MIPTDLLRRFSALIVPAAALASLAGAQTVTPPAGGYLADYPPSTSNDAEVVPQPTPPPGVIFESVLALDQRPGDMQPQLRGGFEAASETWQALLFTAFPGGGSCTAALVGPQTVLTAAHCVPNGQISFKFPGKAGPYVAWCAVDEAYTRTTDRSADFALCHLADGETVAVPKGFRYETISLDPFEKLLNTVLTLGGYGCTTEQVADTRPSKKYRIGPALIVENSNSPTRSLNPVFYADPRYRKAEKNNLMTSAADGFANLCKGDSGGPVFRIFPGPTTYDVRLIVGVNSRALFRQGDKTKYGASLIAATGGPRLREWALDWARSYYVCGLSEPRKGFCRGW